MKPNYKMIVMMIIQMMKYQKCQVIKLKLYMKTLVRLLVN